MIRAYVVNKGHRGVRYFPSLESARQYCAGYFQTSGIVLGIESCADRGTFEQLQIDAREARDRRQELKADLDRWYQSASYAPASKRRKLEQLERGERRAWDRFWAYLTAISPRDWAAGVPVAYLVDKLCYSDAVTRGPLREVPPPSYGYTDRHNERFAAALPEVQP